MTHAAAPEPKANMGASAPRIDARAKVTGRARYPSDEPLGNVAYGYLVTSAIAKRRITRIDPAAARAVAGVLDILTYQNASQIKGAKLLRRRYVRDDDRAPQFAEDLARRADRRAGRGRELRGRP